MSKDIDAFTNIMEYHQGVPSLVSFYYRLLDLGEEIGQTDDLESITVTVDAGVYDHMFSEDQEGITKEDDIFILKIQWGFERKEIYKFFKKIQDYLKKAETTGRSFFLNDIYQDKTKGENYWVINYNS